MNNIKCLNKEECTGCLACKSVCPQKCISIEKDDLGFDYPIVDEKKCVNCGLCSKCCPVLNNENEKEIFQDCSFSYIDNDYEHWKDSSSGGAFLSICENYEKQNKNSKYYGAAYNSENISINHIMTDFKNIKKIQKSKYVQSRCEVYESILNNIKAGNKVVFCGTPCQNKALLNYISIKKLKRDNLLLIDIICNGVGSPRTFKESIISFINKKRIRKNDIISVNHRGKRRNCLGYNSYFTQVETKEKDYFIKKNNDFHIKLYSEKINCRDSCESCQFANSNRCTDITIADYKKFYFYNPKTKSNKNASLIICHTKKGQYYVERIKNNGVLLDSPFEIIRIINPQYFKGIGTKANNKRLELKNISKESKEDIISNIPNNFFSKKSLKGKVAELIPDHVREKIGSKIIKR